MTWALLNAAYLVYAISGTFKDMLRLRAILLASTGLFMAYGATAQIWSVFWWNMPVAAVHSYQIWELVKARRSIRLDEEAEAIHTLLFHDLDRTAFNAMWHCGEERSVEDEVLITKGCDVPELMLILSGEVDVLVREDLLVKLSQYRMIGEMSSLGGVVASATVTAAGEVRLRAWDKEKLAECGTKFPEVQVALLQAMGSEVARKLN